MAKNVISGSKGGSSKPYKPKEMADNLISIDKIKILLAVSDGECDPEFSLKNLYLDDVPVQNQDGTLNYEGVTAEFRPGTQTQDYIKGFTDTSSEITVQRKITTDTPYNISVTNKNLSAIRIKMLMPQGVHVESDGDKVGVKVQYAVDMAVDGGKFERVLTDTIDGKTTTGYDRSRRIDLPAFNQQVILRVSRLTADSATVNTVDAIQLQSYAEVIDAKFRYPLTGLVFVEFDSELFPNRIPNIAIKKKWKLIQVPSNYDPETRQYNGSWNGLFKKAWSNNPAWVLYDIITNQRYGLDQRELGIEVDKWSIYQAAQFCDQLVPDGKGGMEPRYLCDVVIQSQIEAYQLIRDICSIFRGMSFWNGESLSIIVDRPREPSYVFTNDNVVDGDFQYTFASEKSMYTQCNVTFDDEQNMYQQDIEGVFEPEAALRFGYNPTSITAIGCTRRSEANRRGRWILKTNLRSTTVNFATGLEGMIPMIGDVIAISDNFFSSALSLNLSGRLMEVSGLQVFLPFAVDARAGDFIMINKPDGKPVKRTISRVSADKKTLMLNTGFGFDVKPDAVFAIERTDLALQQYVVTGITRGDDAEQFTYSITATEYDPNKYDEIDFGVNIDDRPTSILTPDNMTAPENVKLSSYSRVVQGMSVETMVVSWDKVPYASVYEVQWRKDNGNWINVPQTASCEVDVEGIYSGNYHVRVRAVSTAGINSPWSGVVSAHLTGKVGEPKAPINLTASDNQVFGIRIKWGMPAGSGDTAYIELQQAPDVDSHPSEEAATLLTLIPYPQNEYWHATLPPGYINWYRVRSVDRIGNVSPWTEFVRGMSSTNYDDIIGDIFNDIMESEGFKELQESAIDTNAKVQQLIGSMKNQAQADIDNALAIDANMKWTRVQNGKRIAEHGKSLELIANEKEARIEAIEVLRTQFDEGITAEITDVKKLITNESESRAQQVNQVKAEFTSEIGKVNSAIDGVKGDLKKTNANVTNAQNAIANESEARANDVKNLETKFTSQINGAKNELQSNINRIDQAVTNEAGARAQAVSSLDSKFTGQINGVKQELSSNISTVNQSIASEREARTQAITALSTRVGNTETGLTQKLDSWATTAGSIGSQYALKLGIKRAGVEYTCGVSLSLVQSGSEIKSQFLVDAARFGVMSKQGSSYTLPFVVEGSTVYINSVLIKNGSITNAMIGNEIRSDNFVSGSAGWRILKNGSAEFSNATFRGTVYASAGSFTGTVNATSGKFKGTVEAESFVGDVVNAGVGPDKVREVAGTVKANITYKDSAATNKPKTVIVQAMITARAPRSGQEGILGIYAVCNGTRKEIPYVACPSVSPTVIPVHFAFTGITAQTVNVEIGTNNRSGQTEASAHSIYAPTVMIARGSGSFSYS
jgi:predicted phage tail protein